MPIGDIVANEDLACRHHHHHHPHPPKPPFPPMPQPAWFVPPPMPLPIPVDYPHFDPYHPCPDHDDDKDKEQEDKEKEELKASIEAQICMLSKRAAAIKAMIDNFKNKNKDAIIRIGGTSYNFGTYQITKKDEEGHETVEETEYGEVILGILTTELGLIKEKITELANLLEQEEDATTLGDGIYTTVTQG